MKGYKKFKQKMKKIARYTPVLSVLLARYLQRKTTKESLPELIRESTRFYQLLARYRINVVLDVGAHNGITGVNLRDHGYTSRIVSFEPLPDVFLELSEWSKLAPPWECYPYALGERQESKKIKVLGNKFASSFLDGQEILRRELAQHGGGHVEKEELVEVKKLDDLYPNLCKESDIVLLKIDTQGYEKKVLEGALKSLKHIRFVKMELSLVEIYKHETVMHEMIAFMTSLGYAPILLERGHVSDETLYQLQADVIFTNLRYETDH